MKINELLAEDVEAMQAINRMSQQIVDYLNRNPNLVKVGSRIPLDSVVTTAFKDPTLEYLRRSVVIELKELSEFKTVDMITGQQSRNMPWGTQYSAFSDPKGRVTSPAGSDLVRQDRFLHKTGGIADNLDRVIARGDKMVMNLPAEILTRSIELPRKDPEFNAREYNQRRADHISRAMRTTISHELNHGYNNLQGMDLGQARSKTEQNASKVKMFRDIDALVKNPDDPTLLKQFKKMMQGYPSIPPALKKYVEISQEILDDDRILEVQRNQIQKAADAAKNLTGEERLAAEQEVKDMRRATDQFQRQIESKVKQQTNLANQLTKMAPPPDTPTNYKDDVYFSSKTELNSRLQQASVNIADALIEFKKYHPDGNIPNETKRYILARAFSDNQITQEYMKPDHPLLKQHFGDPANLNSKGTEFNRNFKQWMSAPGDDGQAAGKIRLTAMTPDIQLAAWESASKNPEFKRFVNIGFKFMDAELANPTMSRNKQTLGMKLRALLTGIPVSEIPNTILPNYKDSLRSAVFQAMNPDSPMYKNLKDIKSGLIADTVELSKRLDTPAALKTIRYGGAVLMTVSAAVEIKRGYDQIQALSPNLTEQQHKQEVTKIVTKLIAEFGLVWVSAYIGALLAGTAATAVLPGLGTVAVGIVGFIGGAAAGVAALNFAGETVEQIVEKLVDAYYKNPKAKQIPKPVGEPAYTEELVRIRTLADLGP